MVKLSRERKGQIANICRGAICSLLSLLRASEHVLFSDYFIEVIFNEVSKENDDFKNPALCKTMCGGLVKEMTLSGQLDVQPAKNLVASRKLSRFRAIRLNQTGDVFWGSFDEDLRIDRAEEMFNNLRQNGMIVEGLSDYQSENDEVLSFIKKHRICDGYLVNFKYTSMELIKESMEVLFELWPKDKRMWLKYPPVVTKNSQRLRKRAEELKKEFPRYFEFSSTFFVYSLFVAESTAIYEKARELDVLFGGREKWSEHLYVLTANTENLKYAYLRAGWKKLKQAFKGVWATEVFNINTEDFKSRFDVLSKLVSRTNKETFRWMHRISLLFASVEHLKEREGFWTRVFGSDNWKQCPQLLFTPKTDDSVFFERIKFLNEKFPNEEWKSHPAMLIKTTSRIDKAINSIGERYGDEAWQLNPSALSAYEKHSDEKEKIVTMVLGHEKWKARNLAICKKEIPDFLQDCLGISEILGHDGWKVDYYHLLNRGKVERYRIIAPYLDRNFGPNWRYVAPGLLARYHTLPTERNPHGIDEAEMIRERKFKRASYSGTQYKGRNLMYLNSPEERVLNELFLNEYFQGECWKEKESSNLVTLPNAELRENAAFLDRVFQGDRSWQGQKTRSLDYLVGTPTVTLKENYKFLSSQLGKGWNDYKKSFYAMSMDPGKIKRRAELGRKIFGNYVYKKCFYDIIMTERKTLIQNGKIVKYLCQGDKSLLNKGGAMAGSMSVFIKISLHKLRKGLDFIAKEILGFEEELFKTERMPLGEVIKWRQSRGQLAKNGEKVACELIRQFVVAHPNCIHERDIAGWWEGFSSVHRPEMVDVTIKGKQQVRFAWRQK